jgi:hypothetical protein
LRRVVDAVFRAEERGEGDSRRGGDEIGGVVELGIDGGGVADEADATAAERGEAGVAEYVQAGAHRSPGYGIG